MKVDIAHLYDRMPGGTYRILVDRLWPRGIKKTSTKVDVWLKDVAPSNELRKGYGHEEAKAAEFARRYCAELDENAEAVRQLRALIDEHESPLLVFAARGEHTNAHVLQRYLAQHHEPRTPTNQ